jgi:MFS superfamily sulfate permease-like transporter
MFRRRRSQSAADPPGPSAHAVSRLQPVEDVYLLFFANARTFRDQVRRLARSEPTPRWIVVAAEPITDVDTTAADMLEDLDEALNAKGISLVFADMKDPVREKIERYELTRTIDPAHFFPTVGAAVAAFQDQFGADWVSAAGKQAR